MKHWKPIAIGGAILGGVGALVLIGRGGKPSSTAPRRVALIGDSYAVGLGPKLAKLIPDFKYAGVVGTNTSQWANHSKACGTCGDWLTTFKPDVVLVSLGVNDHFSPAPPISGVPTRPYTGTYQQIVSALHGIGARVVWIEPPAAVNAPATRAAIASLGVPVVPATTTPLAASDPLHLHPASYAPWASEIAGAIGVI